MRLSRFVVMALLAGFVVGCSTASQKAEQVLDQPIAVNTKIDSEADFGKYRTWSFVPLRADAGVDPRLTDAGVTAAFDDAVEREMFTRGYRRVEVGEGPDLLVNVHAAIEKIDAAYIQEHYEGSYEPGYRTEIGGKKLAKEWEEGTVIIIIFDSRTKTALWGASAQVEVYPDLDPETRRRRIDKGVGLMMESLPAAK